MNRPNLPARIRHAYTYVRHNILPPDPQAEANAILWLTLGSTGNVDTALATAYGQKPVAVS